MVLVVTLSHPKFITEIPRLIKPKSKFQIHGFVPVDCESGFLLQSSFFAIFLKNIIDNNPRIIPRVLSAVISMERIASLPRNHHMTYTTIIIPGHKDKIEINEAETQWPR